MSINLDYITRLKVVKKIKKKQKKLAGYLPEHLAKDFIENSYCAGGAIHSLYNGKKPKDYDFFIKNKEYANALTLYFNSLPGLKIKWSNGLPIRIGNIGGKTLIITRNAISVGNFQIILKDVGDPLTVISKFDFKHNMHYIEFDKLCAIDDDYNLDHYQLLYNENRARDIAATMMRVSKFTKKGFTIESREIAKILLSLHKFGMSDEEIMLLENSPSSTSFGS